MANHKSAEKRNRQSQVRRMRNRINKQKMKTSIRRLEASLADGGAEQGQEALQRAISLIAKTAGKGTIHKKTASRKISRLTKNFNKIQATA